MAGGVSGDSLQLGLNALQVVGRVLAIDDQPVKPRQGADFGGVGAGQAHPEANLGLFVLKGLFE
jgi:hypothetical protein